MKGLVSLAGVVFLFVPSDRPARIPPDNYDLAVLQGVWEIEAIEFSGKPIAPPAGYRIEVRGNRYTENFRDAAPHIVQQLATWSFKSPKYLEKLGLGEPLAGGFPHQIYKIEGYRFTFAFNTKGPLGTAFSGDGIQVVMLRRVNR
jgi:uncharacterized protein (TIGR03067 family)